MTTTTAATQAIRSIPAAGITATIGDVVVTAFPHPQAGFLIQARRNGVHAPDLCSRHNLEWDALQAWKRLTADLAAQAEAPAVKLNAPKGGATKMSPAEVTVIGEALDSTGHIRRGRGAASADLASLKAMARRGFITLTGPQFRPNGGDVTDWGKRVHKENVAEWDAQRDREAKLAAVYTFAA